eukprot:jgi/Chrzof1/13325/Cz07g28290.t1
MVGLVTPRSVMQITVGHSLLCHDGSDRGQGVTSIMFRLVFASSTDSLRCSCHEGQHTLQMSDDPPYAVIVQLQ